MAPIVCPLSATMSSVPEVNEFIIQEAVVWKSGWAKIDWSIHFVVQPYVLQIYFLKEQIYYTSDGT